MSFSNIMDSNSYSADHPVDPATESLIAARDRMLGPAYRLFYQRPVHLVRGEGTRLYDADGACYLDAYNNVAAVGHCHPHVVDSVSRQLSTLNTHTRYLHGGIVDYSQRLLDTMPEQVDQVMYACTGSEVNDLALRVAEMHTGAKGVIVTSDAYHGNTAAVTAISPSIGGATALGEHVRAVPPPDSYRIPAEELAEQFTAGVVAAIADLQAAGSGLSALIVDTVFSSDGIYPDPSVLAPAVEAVHRAGGIFIADEVQPGFARTGEAMWGFFRHGVVPDLVTMGKPMGNGLPIAAMAARAEVLDTFARGVPYFNTFGGNPVTVAAAAAVLDVIDDESLMRSANDVGTRLRDELDRLGAGHPRIGDVRGSGLYIGVEVITETGTPDRAGARALVNAMRDRRVLISVCGRDGNVLKIRPPLVFSNSDVDWFCTEFAAVLTSPF
ncbi:aminotransferase class III-fold pyridoxal phosphate-dependent enzyme [Mycobacterium sp. CVI_P3]|uniref:Aminotransferase class III-fold pyridoxal phosphate-dependent enzyme n=1 Tax=Mycobacterium pinniadriaticum TaxID=2994102 RepID=A0ABT3S951_9MYCO|nr:aminotransferase class III-fold pyridoxal phosphate-dependent enzyme [Mycobacterium pinniadriaticum]MCX2928678.1 aminotransferase class III-fold pyridoxal phosphate-dependent enzyme [Mycobacterium pinniadriaticum]MCX2935455.1 aminotransferase class III-fold pyridoxal phosphate-dependent enzyme [Mycobacterium pinniadriaticum]